MSCGDDDGPAIEVRDLWHHYGSRPALEDISLEIPPGAFAALIGPNGAGKSTLLRLLLGVIKPQRGQISILGRPPGEQGQPIGYVPQRIELPHGFPLAVRDVVLMGRYGNLGFFRRPSAEDHEAVERSLGTVEMEHLAGRRFQDLSGGQQQRVLIARALVGNPCLLILDEPTAGLDPPARARFYAQVCDLQRARGLTLFCASHDVEDVAQHAQALILLDRSVKASGPPQEVLKSPAMPEVYDFPPPHLHAAAGEHPHGHSAGIEGTGAEVDARSPGRSSGSPGGEADT